MEPYMEFIGTPHNGGFGLVVYAITANHTLYHIFDTMQYDKQRDNSVSWFAKACIKSKAFQEMGERIPEGPESSLFRT